MMKQRLCLVIQNRSYKEQSLLCSHYHHPLCSALLSVKKQHNRLPPHNRQMITMTIHGYESDSKEVPIMANTAGTYSSITALQGSVHYVSFTYEGSLLLSREGTTRLEVLCNQIWQLATSTSCSSKATKESETEHHLITSQHETP
jgi:hypothetical protein